MNEKTRHIVIYAIFGLTVVWGIVTLADKKPRPAEPTATAATSITGSEPSADVPTADLPVKDWAAEYRRRPWGRDPFYQHVNRTADSSAVDQATLRLLGILYREVNPQALINGAVFTEGDSIQGYRVVKIAREHITLQGRGKTVELRVAKESS